VNMLKLRCEVTDPCWFEGVEVHSRTLYRSLSTGYQNMAVIQCVPRPMLQHNLQESILCCLLRGLQMSVIRL
jgi:hypothetical protein